MGAGAIGGMEGRNKYNWLGKIIRHGLADISALNFCEKVLNVQFLYYYVIVLLKKHQNVLKCTWRIRL